MTKNNFSNEELVDFEKKLKMLIIESYTQGVRDGSTYEREVCAELAEAAMSDDNKYDIANAIRARGEK